MPPKAFAIAAHPDDIEFMMSGTLILLHEAGYEIHYMNVANGSCGTTEYDRETIATLRRTEAIEAASSIGAIHHESLVNDLEIFYENHLLKRLSAIVREVAPRIVLTHSPWEYMEDHSNTCRLVVTAAFVRGMSNFSTLPPIMRTDEPTTIYHALPYGLRDPLRKKTKAGIYVNVTETLEAKTQMLAMHKSQKKWLDYSQGLDSYLIKMKEMCEEVGRLSGRYSYAEGWIRHLPLGYCDENANPLVEALQEKAFVNESFENDLN